MKYFSIFMLGFLSMIIACTTTSISQEAANKLLMDGLQAKDPKAIKDALNKGADAKMTLTPGSNFLVWHSVCQQGVAEVIPDFLDRGVDPNAKTDAGDVCLHAAAERNQAAVIYKLRDYEKAHSMTRVDWNATSNHLGGGWTPAHTAVEYRHCDALKALRASGADLSKQTSPQVKEVGKGSGIPADIPRSTPQELAQRQYICLDVFE